MRLFLILLFLFTNIYAAKTLIVVTRNSPTTYYFGSDDKPWGFEYDLINEFAKTQGYKVKWLVKPTIDEVLKSIEKKQADIAAAGLTKNQERSKKFLMGPAYFYTNEKVVCGEKKFPKNIEELIQYDIQVSESSSYINTLKKIQKKHPKLKWSIAKGLSTEEIFQDIEDKKIDCTIADSQIASINIRYFPILNIRFSVAKDQSLVWMMPKSKMSEKLQNKMNQWFKTFKTSSKYAYIMDKHFSHVKVFNYYDVITYHKRIKSLLPKYLNNFKKSAKNHNIAWEVLAAQSYQESHWDPHAKSPTGVRGMMMITLNTAKDLGVTNRLDYNQSIEGGAKYLRQLLNRIPKDVKSQVDRYKFALAAYNVGMGHLQDAIVLGKRLNINPYLWVNMKDLLPLLSKAKYYKTLKYGYARGFEPVKYVSRISNYYEILYNEFK